MSRKTRNSYRVVMEESFKQGVDFDSYEKLDNFIKEQRCSKIKTKSKISFPERQGKSIFWNNLTPYVIERRNSRVETSITFAVSFQTYDAGDARSIAEQIANEFNSPEYRLELCVWNLLDTISLN